MPKETRLVIDIGTNSVLALLAEVGSGDVKVISDRKKTTKLGEGLARSGRLTKEAIKRTVSAVAEFRNGASFDSIALVGTEALRQAQNSSDFCRALKDSIGYEPILLSGRKEAELSYLGALYNLTVEGSRVILIDVGGGSTELVAAHGGEIVDLVSVPVGALKIKGIGGDDSLLSYQESVEDILEKAISGFHGSPQGTVIATGGTITAAAAIFARIGDYDPKFIHGMRLERDDLLEIGARFEMAGKQARKSLIPFDPERAELMLPGLGIFLAFMGIISQESLVVSAGGLRFGAALYPEKIST